MYKPRYDEGGLTLIIIKKKVNTSSQFSSNSAVPTSEILENHEEMFPPYYIHSDVVISFIPIFDCRFIPNKACFCKTFSQDWFS